MKTLNNLLLITLISTSLAACTVGNQVISKGADASAFAGNINVSANGRAGNLSTTNGNIVIEQQAQAKSVNVTNGNITVRERAKAISLKTTNGNIHIENSASIASDVSTTNGNIEIAEHAIINGALKTTTGDINIASATIVKGDIIFEAPGFLAAQLEREIPKLTVDNTSVIEGKIHLYQPVDLQLAQPLSAEQVVRHYQK